MVKKKHGNSGRSKRSKLQELVPPGREPIYQGQQFDEMQRQHKNPDNTVRPKEPRSDPS